MNLGKVQVEGIVGRGYQGEKEMTAHRRDRSQWKEILMPEAETNEKNK